MISGHSFVPEVPDVENFTTSAFWYGDSKSDTYTRDLLMEDYLILSRIRGLRD
jgi:hypothetical protein